MRTRCEMTMVGNWQRWGNAGVGSWQVDAEGMGAFHEAELAAGVAQARVVDLRNANAAWIAFENRRQDRRSVVELFRSREN
jgi:hypothetical protein